MTLDTLVKQLYAIGGIDRCGQPGFCLLIVLYIKALELGSFKYKATNKELMYKAGFGSRQHYNTVREQLVEEQFLTYTPVNAKKSIIEIYLNTNILNISRIIDEPLTNCLQTVDESLTNHERDNLIDKSLTKDLQTVDESLTSHLQTNDKQLTKEKKKNETTEDPPLQGLLKSFQR